jgi:quercetin dioxygenase-like cupin family protein
MIKKLCISLLLVSALAWGQTSAMKTKSASKSAASAQPVVLNLDGMKWGPAPAELPPGAQLAVLEGDPSKVGPYTVRLKMPDGYKIQPHWHPTVEHVTVLSGTLKVGMGATWDNSNPTTLSSGGFAVMPARMKHFAWTSGDTVLQLNGTGPFKIIYVNPNDSPMKPAPVAK